MIKKYGQSVTWRTIINGTPSDPTKPWKPSNDILVDNTVRIAFLPRNKEREKSLQYRKDSEVPKGLLLGYMGQASFTPKLKDVIIRGDKQYVVETIDTVEPNNEGVILYTMELGAPDTVSSDVVTNHVWTDELDNVVGVFDDANNPTVEYGYPCFEGNYIKAGEIGLTYGLANNPNFLYQCDDGETTHPPTDFAHLKGIPLADLNYSDCDSTAVGDFNWTRRGLFNFGTAGSIIGNGQYEVSQTGQTQSGIGLPGVALPVGSLKGQFQRDVTPDVLHNVGFSVTIGGVVYGIYAFAFGAGSHFITVTKNGSPMFYLGMFPDQEVRGEIRWDGVDVSAYVYDVYRWGEANAGSQSSAIYPSDGNTAFGPGGALQFRSGPFELRDAPVGGNLLYITLVGVSC